MVLYRRNFVAGGTYAFTVTLRDRSSKLLTDHVDLLRAAYKRTHEHRPFTTVAICVLPDHLHCIWTLPPDDSNYSARWTHIKMLFVKSLDGRGINVERNQRGEANVWQRRFYEHTVRDERDLQTHVDYIHHNPVKHGLVARAADWPHSSIHTFIARGELTRDGAHAPANA
jgi:putative transposase